MYGGLNRFLNTEEGRKKMGLILTRKNAQKLFKTCNPDYPETVFKYLTATRITHLDSVDNGMCDCCDTSKNKCD